MMVGLQVMWQEDTPEGMDQRVREGGWL